MQPKIDARLDQCDNLGSQRGGGGDESTRERPEWGSGFLGGGAGLVDARVLERIWEKTKKSLKIAMFDSQEYPQDRPQGLKKKK